MSACGGMPSLVPITKLMDSNVHTLPTQAANEPRVALGRALQIATSRFVSIGLAAVLTGLTKGAIEMKIAKGVWIEDRQYVRRDGRVLIAKLRSCREDLRQVVRHRDQRNGECRFLDDAGRSSPVSLGQDGLRRQHTALWQHELRAIFLLRSRRARLPPLLSIHSGPHTINLRAVDEHENRGGHEGTRAWPNTLNRRAEVKNVLFEVAAAKRPMLTREERRALAIKLGTPKP